MVVEFVDGFATYGCLQPKKGRFHPRIPRHPGRIDSPNCTPCNGSLGDGLDSVSVGVPCERIPAPPTFQEATRPDQYLGCLIDLDSGPICVIEWHVGSPCIAILRLTNSSAFGGGIRCRDSPFECRDDRPRLSISSLIFRWFFSRLRLGPNRCSLKCTPFRPDTGNSRRT